MAELPDILKTYREIQTLDQEEAELEAQLTVCRKRLTELEQRREEREREAADEKQALEEMKRRRRKLEQTLADKGARVKKLKTQMMNIISAKEYQAMTGELGRLREKMDRDETLTLELMEQEESVVAKLAAQERESADVQTEFAKERERLAAQIDDKRQKLAARVGERGELLERIDDIGARQRLDNLRAQYGCHYLVEIVNGCCGGCRMAQTAQTQLLARLQRELVLCEGCSRVLVGNQDPKTQPADKASAG